MKRVELYINGQLVDLPTLSELNLRINKVVESRDTRSDVFKTGKGGSFVYTIGLPVSPANQVIFGHIESLQTIDKFNKDFNYEASLYVDSTLELKGLFRIGDVSKRTYEGEIYSDNISWLILIQNKSLRDLVFAPAPFTGAFADYSYNSYLEKSFASSDIQFPLCSYGNFFNANPALPANRIESITFEDYTPSVYFINVISRILSSVGWSAKGKIFNDTSFQKLVLPYVGSEPYRWNWRTMGYYKATAAFNSSFTVLQDYSTSRNAATGDYIAKIDARYLITLKATYTNGSEEPITPPASIIIWDATRSEILGETLPADGVINPGETRQLVTTLDIELQEGERIAFGVTSAFNFQIEYEITLPDEATDINVGINLPDIPQERVMQAFINMFNLYFDANPESKTITFYSKGEYFKDKGFVVNVDKVTGSEDYQISEVSTYKQISFSYTHDEDDYELKRDKDFANYKYNNPSQAATGDLTVQVAFAATRNRDFEVSAFGLSITTPSLPSIAESISTPLNEVDWRYSYQPRLIEFVKLNEGQLLINGQVSAYGGGVFPDYLKWENLYKTYYNLAQNNRGHRLIIKPLLSREMYRKLEQRYNVEFAGDSYELESMESYDPLQQSVSTLKLIKRV